MKPWIKILRRAVIATLVLALATIIILLVSWNGELNEEIEALRESGARLEPSEFTPPAIPAEENGALLYQKVFLQALAEHHESHPPSC